MTELNIEEAETQHGSQVPVPDKDAPQPKLNYFVPNFGKDSELRASDESLSLAEGKLKTKFDAEFKKPEEDKSYTVPNFGVDYDIKDTLNHEKAAETSVGYVWNVDAVQLDSSLDRPHNRRDRSNIMMMSDPITDSTGEVSQYTHPTDEKKKHKMNYFVPNFGPDQEMVSDKANVEKVEAKLGHVFTPTEAGDGHKMNYRVPNFGPDPDIIGT